MLLLKSTCVEHQKKKKKCRGQIDALHSCIQCGCDFNIFQNIGGLTSSQTLKSVSTDSKH